ncbi:hypothetical protein [Natrinema versiforme]|uniref:DUF8163 domain-containing protein n=1 Tax=Natrinema versiforme JCM 10478 TaxID=1227496 RepID=L9XML2_9EURY|nr:hypothetical protein [Natrinema versiforme]ELY62807.1 hypothetical protein C489_21061 [Natrinema versiforme JCM 10478]
MSVRIDAVPAATGRDWLTVGTFAILVATFTVVAGSLGALAGIATAVVWYVLGTPYALAVGHVALVASAPSGIDPLAVVIVEAAFIVVLLAPVRRTASPGRIALVAVASSVVLTGTAWLVADLQSIQLAATTVLLLFAITVYGCHRYELVRLGLVPNDDGGSSSPATGESTDEQTTESSAKTTTDLSTDI